MLACATGPEPARAHGTLQRAAPDRVATTKSTSAAHLQPQIAGPRARPRASVGGRGLGPEPRTPRRTASDIDDPRDPRIDVSSRVRAGAGAAGIPSPFCALAPPTRTFDALDRRGPRPWRASPRSDLHRVWLTTTTAHLKVCPSRDIGRFGSRATLARTAHVRSARTPDVRFRFPVDRTSRSCGRSSRSAAPPAPSGSSIRASARRMLKLRIRGARFACVDATCSPRAVQLQYPEPAGRTQHSSRPPKGAGCWNRARPSVRRQPFRGENSALTDCRRPRGWDRRRRC